MLAIAIAAPVALESCVSPSSYRRHKAAEAFAARDAKAEARLDIAAGDFRVYGAMGMMGRYYPGLSQPEGRRIDRKFGCLLIPDTTDAVESEAHWEYIEAAVRHASDYNVELAKRLRATGKL